jgi:predicted nuclease of predicted toxin-antitoxin system
VKLKLDENLPEAARLVAASLGHDVDTAIDEGLTGAGDHDVLAAAMREQRFVVTASSVRRDNEHWYHMTYQLERRRPWR